MRDYMNMDMLRTAEVGASSDLRVGQRVRVVGLKARPELNGRSTKLPTHKSAFCISGEILIF